ncbi:MAG: preprotein translocase subunit SecY [Candidatus Kerfeldbacteria bacterium]|nr:preprotein translocase subunit SecY [Candidatus Kerfeldbacteria bacterium]
MLQKLRHIWEAKDLRSRLFVVLGLLIIYRVLSHIPVPGVDTSGLQALFSRNQVLGLLNIFSGGALENFSVVMLSVGPYITASIVMQLLTFIVPSLEELQKEGERGRNKINQYTRILTIPFAILQAYGTLMFLGKFQGGGGLAGAGSIFEGLTPFQIATAIIAVTAGSVFTMWLGEIISEKQVGNGISLLIFAGIISGIPQSFQQVFSVVDARGILNLILFVLIALVTIAGVVFITEGQRNIPIAQARAGMLGRGASPQSHLPLRVNQAGVIPIIFAISIVILPSIVAQFFVDSGIGVVADAAQWIIRVFNSQLYYGIIYFVMVVAFTYFYTYVIFKPDQIAENLQKRGAFIPGIRPGTDTERYLSFVSNRLLVVGALFLGVIAILPLAVQQITGLQTLTVGGTSLLIVVSVVIETVKQIDSQLVMRDYRRF